MLAEFKATDATVRLAIAHPNNAGRIPLARLTYGDVSGLGWGFLHPWQQLALFPLKGTPGGIGHRDRQHERFFLRALVPHDDELQHPRMTWTVAGRYWEGVAWRASWGRRMRIVVLDPDRIYQDNAPTEWSDFDGF